MPDRSYIAFGGLFFVATLARAILLSVLPLQALALLQSPQQVSVMFFAISLGGISASLSIPAVIGQLGGYRTFLLGAGIMSTSSVLLATGVIQWFAIGLFLHVFAIAAMEVALNVHIMQRIPRRELTRFEPIRVLCAVGALSIGPWLGVYLESRVLHWLPFAITIGACGGAVVYYRLLGLHLVRVDARSANPLRHLRRFFGQPRLRLAWALSVGRSAWWMMFVIYTPIYAELSGLGALRGAAIVSIGTAWTLTVPFWGWVARRYGLRRLLVLGFAATGVASIAVYVFAGNPSLALALLVVAALAATILDGAGHVPYFRAVRSWERSEMTGVFMTYRDASQLAVPGLFAVLLKMFALPVVFVSAGVWMFAGAWVSRFIPRRM